MRYALGVVLCAVMWGSVCPRVDAGAAGDWGVPPAPAVPSWPSLPWIPVPRPSWPFKPPGTPPFLPPVGPASGGGEETPPLSAPDTPGGLPAALRQAVGVLAQWAEVVRRVTAQVLAQIVAEAPGYLPWGAQFPDLLGQIQIIPRELRGALDEVAAKLGGRGRTAEESRHAAAVASSPELTHESRRIVGEHVLMAVESAEQEAAIRAAGDTAAAAARDPAVPEAVREAHETAAALLEGSRTLPSSRAGIELVAAGLGREIQQQADLDAALAGRLTALVQQTAAVSQQVGGLAAVTGALAARDVDRDRRALDAELGLADAVEAGGRLLRDALARSGEGSRSEIKLDPLY